MRSRLDLPGVIVAIALWASCGQSTKDRAPAPPAGLPGPGGAAAASVSAKPERPGTPPAAATGLATAGQTDLLGGALPATKAGGDEPADLLAVKSRIIAGERDAHTLKDVQKLSSKYPKNAEVAYILGQLYCDKLWMGDGLTAFRRALQLDPTYRSNPYLIRAAVPGLGNDSDYKKVHRFLVQDIGKPAVPFVEEVLQGSWRQQVKDRASAILQELK